ncbi:histidinol dehydrogenase [Fibrobacterales bacterium]|nr:histidinol dehydrogenase [Fibrobacterales bacterium]
MINADARKFNYADAGNLNNGKQSVNIPIIKVSSSSPEVARLSSRPVAGDRGVEKLVREILAEVKSGGAEAAIKFAKKYDGLTANTLKISPADIKKSAASLSLELQIALKKAIINVRTFHKKQVEKSWDFRGKDGEILGQKIRPLNRVGLYVPGGAGVYPSTLIMNAVPAIVAGVKELVVVSPAKGGLQASVAFVLHELGIKEVYHIGGAQAIGLLAYGSGNGKSEKKGGRNGVSKNGQFEIAPVDKIVGPGNVFAATAKREVFGIVDIDMIAGPSEIAVLADETANAEWVAADMLSQAEHGSGFEASVCVTNSPKFAKEVAKHIAEQVEKSPKREILEKSLNAYGRILLAKNMESAAEIVNKIAPEHLEIIAENQDELEKLITNAGAIFVGSYSSEPVGDYFAGPNHVLPTNGTARFASPLGVYDFLKRTSIIRYNQKALLKNGRSIAAIAHSEGFYHHARAVEIRLDTKRGSHRRG